MLWAHFDSWRHSRRCAYFSGQAFFPGGHLCNKISAVSYDQYIRQLVSNKHIEIFYFLISDILNNTILDWTYKLHQNLTNDKPIFKNLKCQDLNSGPLCTQQTSCQWAVMPPYNLELGSFVMSKLLIYLNAKVVNLLVKLLAYS